MAEKQIRKISQPSVTGNSSGYHFFWEEGDEENIAIGVTRLDDTKSGIIQAELEVLATSGEGEPESLIAHARTNLLSLSGRQSLVRYIEQNCSDNVVRFYPWRQIINQVCDITVTKRRHGEEVQEIFTTDDTERPEYLLEPLIIKNYPNVIFGDPSSSKSTLALILYQVMALPWEDNPMGITAPLRPIKGLYLDWETDRDTIQWQTTLLQRGMDAGIMFLNYRRCSAPLVQDMEQIKHYIRKYEAEFIIIDSLGLASGGDLKETQPALQFHSALRSLNITSLILAHNSKDRETRTRSIYGNQYYTAQARNIWEVRKQQEPGSNEIEIGLFHRKPPPFKGIHTPLGFKMIFNDDNLVVKSTDPHISFSDQMSNRARIKEYLSAVGSASVKDITEATDIPQGSVSVMLTNRMKDEVVKLPDGTYGLKATITP